MATKLIEDGIWTWFNPQEVTVVGNDLVIAAWNSDGQPVVARYEADSKTQITAVLPGWPSTYEVDDHDNPSILNLASGKILIAFSMHAADSFSYTTTEAGNIREWTPRVVMTSGSSDSYAQLIQVSDTNDTIYRFFRRQVSGTHRPHYFQTSTDDGAAWSSPTQFIDVASQRPYFRFWKTSGSRIDFAFTEGLPSEVTGCSIYHGYMTISGAGTREYFTSDGTSLGGDANLPFSETDFTQVYDGTTNESWIWDCKNIGGNPVVAFVVYDGTAPSDLMEYWRGVWNGTSWSTEKIADAGTTAATDLLTSGTQYAGGVAIDPQNEDVMFLSREYGSNDFRVERWLRNGTWAKTSDLSGGTSTKNARPVAVNAGGTTTVLWWEGTYTTAQNYATAVWIDPDASFRTAKPFSPILDVDFIPPTSNIILPFQDGSGAPSDLLENHTVSEVGSITWTDTTFGYHASGFTTANYITFDAHAGPWIAGSYPRWVACLIENTDTSNAVVWSYGHSVDGDPVISLQLNPGGTAGNVRAFMRNDARIAFNLDATSQPCNDGNKHVYVIVMEADNTRRLILDGVEIASTTSDPEGTISLNQATIGALRLTSVLLPFNGKMYAFASGYGEVGVINPLPDWKNLTEDWLTGRFSGMAESVTPPSGPPLGSLALMGVGR